MSSSSSEHESDSSSDSFISDSSHSEFDTSQKNDRSKSKKLKHSTPHCSGRKSGARKKIISNAKKSCDGHTKAKKP